MYKDRIGWNNDNELFYGKEVTKEEIERNAKKLEEYQQKVLSRVKIITEGFSEIPFEREEGWTTYGVEWLEEAISFASFDELEDFEKEGRIYYDGGYFDLSMLDQELPKPEEPDEETLKWLKEMGLE